MMDKENFKPVQREAIDGKIWWVVYDIKKKDFSALSCFGKYRTKKACQWDIDYFCFYWHNLFGDGLTA